MPITLKTHSFGTSGHDGTFYCIRWTGVTNASTLEQWTKDLEAFLRSTEGERFFFMVVPPNVPVPAPETRPQMAAILDRVAPHGARMGIVFETQGFAAAVVRNLAAAVVLMAKNGRMVSIAGSMDDLVAKLPHGLKGRASDAKALYAAVSTSSAAAELRAS
jgi:hypothetical protein